MLELISKKIANHWSDIKLIPEEDTDLYRYGIEIGLSTLVNLFYLLITTILFFDIIDLIVFIIFFVILRQFTGGYHANTYTKCNLVTIICYSLSTFFAKNISINKTTISLLCIIGLALIITTVPINNRNKTITKTQNKKYKKFSIIIFITEIAITYAMQALDIAYASNAFFTILCIIILIPIGILSYNRKENRYA